MREQQKKIINDNKELEDVTAWFLADNGYVSKCLLDDQGNRYVVCLHELIYQLSGREVPSGHEIYHIDGDKLNNFDENLGVRKITSN